MTRAQRVLFLVMSVSIFLNGCTLYTRGRTAERLASVLAACGDDTRWHPHYEPPPGPKLVRFQEPPMVSPLAAASWFDQNRIEWLCILVLVGLLFWAFLPAWAIWRQQAWCAWSYGHDWEWEQNLYGDLVSEWRCQRCLKRERRKELM